MSRIGLRACYLLVLALLFGGGLPAAAHPLTAGLLEVVELCGRWVEARWEEPVQASAERRMRPILPVACEGGGPVISQGEVGAPMRWVIACPGGLIGTRIAVEDIGDTYLLLRIGLQNEPSVHRVLTSEHPAFDIAHQTWVGVLEAYGVLGVEHISPGLRSPAVRAGAGAPCAPSATAGVDDHRLHHGHSVTLALAVLGYVHVPQAPVEAGIALSIVALAIEIVGSNGGKLTWMQRAPWLVSSGFGLLHALGFAGALAEIGLPEGEIPLALLAFNLGIEAGQLSFVVMALLFIAALRRLSVR